MRVLAADPHCFDTWVVMIRCIFLVSLLELGVFCVLERLLCTISPMFLFFVRYRAFSYGTAGQVYCFAQSLGVRALLCWFSGCAVRERPRSVPVPPPIMREGEARGGYFVMSAPPDLVHYGSGQALAFMM